MRQFLNHRFATTVLTVAVLAAFSAPAFAGGGGGGSKSKVNVRVKNLTLEPVAVAVANQKPTNFRGLNPDQVTQFQVNKGKFVVGREVRTLEEVDTGVLRYRTTVDSESFNTGSRRRSTSPSPTSASRPRHPGSSAAVPRVASAISAAA